MLATSLTAKYAGDRKCFKHSQSPAHCVLYFRGYEDFIAIKDDTVYFKIPSGMTTKVMVLIMSYVQRARHRIHRGQRLLTIIRSFP